MGTERMNDGFFECFRQKVGQYAARIAMQWYDERQEKVLSRTYAEFWADVQRFAGELQGRFAGATGKHIGIFAQNSYDYAVRFFGIVCAGDVAVLLNCRESMEKIRDEIAFSDVCLLLADEGFIPALSPVCEPMGVPVYLITETIGPASAFKAVEGSEPDRLAVLIFTSGTLGKNKCVMLTAGNLLATCANARCIFMDFDKYTGATLLREFLSLPLYHVIALHELMGSLYCGYVVNLCLDMRYMYRDLQLMPSDRGCAVTMIVKRWYSDVVSGHQERLGTLCGFLTGGSAMDGEKIRAFEEAGILVATAYGLSETCGTATHNMVNHSHKYASIGRPTMDFTEVKFDDGEICLKGAAVSPGYYKDPEATAEAIQDGWLHTGDLGYMDEDGYIYITGRKKNLIILASGENVSPEELEALLLKNESIREVLVKEKNGKICAEIFCDAEKRQTLRDFVTEVNRSLPFYKRMTLVEFRDEPFEKTGSGKIKRK